MKILQLSKWSIECFVSQDSKYDPTNLHAHITRRTNRSDNYYEYYDLCDVKIDAMHMRYQPEDTSYNNCKTEGLDNFAKTCR